MQEKALCSELFHAAFSVVLKKQKPAKFPKTREQLHTRQLCHLKQGLKTLTNMGKCCSCEVWWKGRTQS